MLPAKKSTTNFIFALMIPVIAVCLHSVVYAFFHAAAKDTAVSENMMRGYISFTTYALYSILFCPVYYILFLKGKKQRKNPSDLTKKQRTKNIPQQCLLLFSTILLGAALQLFTTALLSIISLKFPHSLDSYNNIVDNSFTIKNGVIQIVTVMFIAPIGEELVFRGLTMKLLFATLDDLPEGKKKWRKKTAIIISALLFGLYHGNLVQFCYAFPIGIILGFIVFQTGQLTFSMLLHMAINTSAYFMPAVAGRSLNQWAMALLAGLVLSVILLLFIFLAAGKGSSHETKYFDK